MMRSTFALLAVCSLLAANAHAQGSRASDIPRLANGKPNFSGVWQSSTTANWNLLTHGASAGPPEYGALLATPPGYGIVDGDAIPYLPAAAEQQKRNYEKTPRSNASCPACRARITCRIRCRSCIRTAACCSRISSRAQHAS
jgi:hypothetical protein